jgi:hypothetical protein
MRRTFTIENRSLAFVHRVVSSISGVFAGTPAVCGCCCFVRANLSLTAIEFEIRYWA